MLDITLFVFTFEAQKRHVTRHDERHVVNVVTTLRVFVLHYGPRKGVVLRDVGRQTSPNCYLEFRVFVKHASHDSMHDST